eukprot:3979913-Pyramimonas_sp.AAC.1
MGRLRSVHVEPSRARMVGVLGTHGEDSPLNLHTQGANSTAHGAISTEFNGGRPRACTAARAWGSTQTYGIRKELAGESNSLEFSGDGMAK